MPAGVFRPYTLTDVLSAMSDQNGQQSVDTVTNGVGFFAETDETLSPVAGLLYRAAPEVDQSPIGTTAWSVAKQLGTVAGDWIFIYLMCTDVPSGVACSGFTVVQDASELSALMYRHADGTEGGSFTITGLGGVAVTSVIVTVGGGQSSLDPPSVGSISTATGATSLAVGSITLANSGDWVLWFAGNENGDNGAGYAIMPPAAFTPRGTNGAQSGNPTLMVADNQSLPTGATGAQTGTCASSSNWSGVIVGLTPAATVAALSDDATATVQAPPGWDGSEWGQMTWEAFVQDYVGVFGDGSDGPVTFDGTSTVLGMVPSSSVYTMTRDIFCTAITINSGVTLNPHGYRIFSTGQVVNNGTIQTNGNNASGTNQSTGGAATGSGSFGNGRLGASGTTGAGAAPSGLSTTIGSSASGGAGSNGAGGTGNTATSLANAINFMHNPDPVLGGAFIIFSTTILFMICGGCSGGGDGTNNGGGGGSGAGVIVIFAPTVVNNGTINANGGNGGTPTTGNCGGGGGGQGGLVLIYTLAAWTPGTVNVNGGNAGSGVGTGAAGNAGTIGQVLNTVLV